MKITRLTVAVLALSFAFAAHSQDRYTLKFSPKQGAKWEERLVGDLLNTTMQNQPLGLKGQASSDVKVEVTAADAARERVTLSLSLDNLKAALNGQPAQPPEVEPLKVEVSPQGEFELAEGQDQAATMADTGGIPLVMIAVLAHIVRLPEAPVAVGEEWAYQDKYELPGMPGVQINTRWKLCQVDGDVATIAATAAAALPDFKAPNPIGAGGQVDVQNGKLQVTEMVVEFSLSEARPLSSQAKLKLDAGVDLGGFKAPITITMQYKLSPAE